MEVKKRIIPVFVAVLMVFTMMSMMAGTAFANEELYTQDGFLYKIIDTGSKEAVFIGIVDENGKGIDRIKGELTIPGGINYYGIWYPVIKIENNAFEYQRNLPSEIHTIIIASGSIRGTGGVEEIGERAFLACVGIKSVSLPRSLRKIGNPPFIPFL